VSLKNKDGVALIAAILTAVVLLSFTTVAVSVASTNFNMGHINRRDNAAFYAAESGVKHQIDHMQTRLELIQTQASPPITYSSFYSLFNGNINTAPEALRPLTAIIPSFTSNNGQSVSIIINMVNIPNAGNPRTYTFRSTATIGEESREIEASVTIHWARLQPPRVLFSRAVFTDGDMVVENNAVVHGGLGTNEFNANSVIIRNNAVVHGGIAVSGVAVGPGGGASTVRISNNASVIGGISVRAEELALPNIIFPQGLQNMGALGVGGGTINQSGSYTSFNMSNNANLYLDVRHGDIKILINGNWTMGNNVNIRLIGEGNRAYIFVTGNVVLNNNIQFNVGGDTNGVIIISNGSLVRLDNNADFAGAIYAPNAHFSAGNNVNVSGSVVSRTATLNNNASMEFGAEDEIDEGGFSDIFEPISGYVPVEMMLTVDSWGER